MYLLNVVALARLKLHIIYSMTSPSAVFAGPLVMLNISRQRKLKSERFRERLRECVKDFSFDNQDLL